ncbi:hypothetical protein BO78DRAFT_389793 [Aspergillus sclerotiicarbonarius CBS 121057]|uniref:Transcription factor domain-containing protein n=1 Tax=Aspergillus sclerotiicarbonarius (strain CBS 121057 / IBT 28362) TaxID=1448318 RepID=A0A319DYU8_ASPSB|nr:hypothetical protein BO78DRAFT_389793 [Aspergillus sclerotiicarbonarius CBS 121057]
MLNTLAAVYSGASDLLSLSPLGNPLPLSIAARSQDVGAGPASSEDSTGPSVFGSAITANVEPLQSGLRLGYETSQVADVSTASDEQPDTALPPRSLGVKLLEIFVSRNAATSFLFHEGKLFRDYMSDAMPPFMLRAIFALAALFSEPACRSTQEQYLSERTANRKESDSWADVAGRHVLGRVDRPALETVQTCSILSLYWFAVGDFERAKIHARSHIADATDVILPAVEAPFRPQYVVSSQRMSSAWMPVSCSDAVGSEEPSLIAEFVKALGIYSEVQRLLAHFHEIPIHLRFNEVFALQQKATKLHRVISPAAKYNGTFAGSDSTLTGRAFAVEAVFSLCAINLHRSMVPLFSGQSLDEASLHMGFVDTCTQIVVQQANKFAGMVDGLLSLNFDLSYIPPIAGYCAFVSAAVYAILIHKRENFISPTLSSLRHKLLSSMVLLNDLKSYWAVLQQAWESLIPSLPITISMEDLNIHRQGLIQETVHSSADSDSSRTKLVGPNSGWLLEPVSKCSGIYAQWQNRYIAQDGAESPRSGTDACSSGPGYHEAKPRDHINLDTDVLDLPNRAPSDAVGIPADNVLPFATIDNLCLSLELGGIGSMASSLTVDNDEFLLSLLNSDVDLAMLGLSGCERPAL